MDAVSTDRQLRYAVLVTGLIVTTIAALGVHSYMLEVLGIPFPSQLPAHGWSRLPDRIMFVSGAFAFQALLPNSVLRRPIWLRIGLLFLLLAAISETLVRGPIMQVLTASRWTPYPFLDAAPEYATLLLIAVLLVVVAPYATSNLRRALAIIVVTAISYVAFRPFALDAFSGVVAWTSPREGYTLYNPPYDWHVNVPANVTFIEPVIASLVIAALVSPKLSRNRGALWCEVALLIFALRGSFFTTFTYIGVSDTDAVTAMLSFGQFTLESLTLAMLAATTWVLASSTSSAARVGLAR